MPKSISDFIALDDATYADGAPVSAQTVTRAIRNANHALVNCTKQLVHVSWPVHDFAPDVDGAPTLTPTATENGVGYRFSALWWKPITPRMNIDVGRGVRRATLRLRARIQNGYTVYFAAVTEGGVPTPDVMASYVLAAAGDGTFKQYPAYGTVHEFDVRSAHFVQVWARYVGAPINVNDGNAHNVGPVEFGASDSVQDTTANFGTIDGVAFETFAGTYYEWNHDLYVQIIDSGSGDVVFPPRRIRRSPATTMIEIDGRWNGNPEGTNRQWQLVRGPEVNLQTLSIYEAELTAADVATSNVGHDDALGYGRAHFLNDCIKAALDDDNAVNAGRKRMLVAEPFVFPKRPPQIGTTYTEVGSWPIELSRGTIADPDSGDDTVPIQVAVVLNSTGGTDGMANAEVITQDTAGGNTATTVFSQTGEQAVSAFSYSGGSRWPPVESRIGSLPGQTTFLFQIHKAKVTVADTSTYRQALTVSVKRTLGDPTLYVVGVYAWEIAS